MVDAVERARADAAAAAARSGVSVRELERAPEHAELTRLFDEVWGPRDAALVHENLMTALHHAGNYVAGAFGNGGMVGGTVAFFARGPNGFHLHSHMTGVRKTVQGRGVGRALKLHQRLWSLQRGVDCIVWTFDPLVRHNAYFNLMRLGAVVVGYEENFYGEMSDGINESDQSDRCVVTWELASERVQNAIEGRVEQPDVAALTATGARIVLDESTTGYPVTHPVEGETLLCKIPDDVVSLRKSSSEAARAWRLGLRSTMGSAIRTGYVVSAITDSGWYVLRRRASNSERGTNRHPSRY